MNSHTQRATLGTGTWTQQPPPRRLPAIDMVRGRRRHRRRDSADGVGNREQCKFVRACLPDLVRAYESAGRVLWGSLGSPMAHPSTPKHSLKFVVFVPTKVLFLILRFAILRLKPPPPQNPSFFISKTFAFVAERTTWAGCPVRRGFSTAIQCLKSSQQSLPESFVTRKNRGWRPARGSCACGQSCYRPEEGHRSGGRQGDSVDRGAEKGGEDVLGPVGG